MSILGKPPWQEAAPRTIKEHPLQSTKVPRSLRSLDGVDTNTMPSERMTNEQAKARLKELEAEMKSVADAYSNAISTLTNEQRLACLEQMAGLVKGVQDFKSQHGL